MGQYAIQLSSYALAYQQEYGHQINKGVIFNLMPDSAAIFEIDLAYPKDFLLETVLPKFYEYYQIAKHCRPYPNVFIKNEIAEFSRDLVSHINEV